MQAARRDVAVDELLRADGTNDAPARLPRRRVPPVAIVATAFAAVALGLVWHQLATPGLLYGVYDGDDGVYFGAAVHFIDGVMPYRDFTVLHPPGIMLLMAPLALASHFVGTDVALGWARVLTAAVTVANVLLVAVILRHRGLGAVSLGCAFLAGFPMAVAADNTLLLEPYLVFFCLLGAALCFRGGVLAAGHRFDLGAIALGFAGAVKVWAIFPVLALGALVARSPRRLPRFAIAVAVGFVVPAAPFVLAAPHAFVHDVVITQFARGQVSNASLSLVQRLDYLTGAYGAFLFSAGDAIGLAAGIAAVTIAGFACRPREAIDAFFLLAAGISVAALLAAPEFYNHYAYFSAALLAPLLALRLDAIARALLGRWARSARRRAALRWACVLCVAAALGALLPRLVTFSGDYLRVSNLLEPQAAIDAYVPSGACVLSVDSVFALVADRFTPRASGCPATDDSFGTWIALDPNYPPPSSPPYPELLVSEWAQWLQRANYFVYEPLDVKVPWTPELTSWFSTHYLLLTGGDGWQLYAHVP